MRVAVALLLALAAPARAQTSAEALVGQPVAALVDDRAVATLLRQASGGRQSIVARRLRNPGVPLALAEEGWVYGWTCAPPRCGHEDLFLAHEPATGRVVLMLVDDGVPVFTVPPRSGAWPRALEAALVAFRAALAAR